MDLINSTHPIYYGTDLSCVLYYYINSYYWMWCIIIVIGGSVKCHHFKLLSTHVSELLFNFKLSNSLFISEKPIACWCYCYYFYLFFFILQSLLVIFKLHLILLIVSATIYILISPVVLFIPTNSAGVFKIARVRAGSVPLILW